MRKTNTTIGALALGLLLCSTGGCQRDEQGKTGEKTDKADKREPTEKGGSVAPGEDPGKTEAPAKPPASKHVLVNEYIVCVDSCAPKPAEERPTCHKNCAATVTAGTADQAASACPRGCAETFGTCLLSCYDKNADEAGTCRGSCQQQVDLCMDGCT